MRLSHFTVAISALLFPTIAVAQSVTTTVSAICGTNCPTAAPSDVMVTRSPIPVASCTDGVAVSAVTSGATMTTTTGGGMNGGGESGDATTGADAPEFTGAGNRMKVGAALAAVLGAAVLIR